MTEIYGVGPVLEALRAGRRRVARIWIQPGRERDPRVRELLERSRLAGVDVREAGREELQRRAQGGVHQGVVAEADPLRPPALAELTPGEAGAPSLLLALDGVQDPQNLGAILRTAECAGVGAVIVPRDRAAPLTAAAIKVAEGAAEWVPVIPVVNLVRALEQLKSGGAWAIGLDGEAEKQCSAVDLRVPTVLVLGSEGQGIRRLVRETCDEVVALPMRGRIGSLNVAAAAAAALYEVARQRLEPG